MSCCLVNDNVCLSAISVVGGIVLGFMVTGSCLLYSWAVVDAGLFDWFYLLGGVMCSACQGDRGLV